MRGARGTRPSVTFIAWTPVSGRSAEIAEALDGEARCFYTFRIVRKPLVPLRYGWSALGTASYLARRRPRAVIASNPPIFPGLIALLYAKLARVPIVLDSHTGSFGLKGDRVSRLLLPAHAWLARRATATLVAADELAERVREWGGRPQVVHEAPPHWEVAPPAPLGERPIVLVVSTFDHDEAVEHVVEAARLVSEIQFRLTGDLRKCPPGLYESLPPNVELVGFLRGDDYVRAVASADVVVALTTEPQSVVRAGYEAVYSQRPLVVSDWPVLREVFPHAVHVENEPDAIASGVRAAIARHAELAETAPLALELQRRRWDCQLATLKATLASRPADAPIAVRTPV